MNEINLVTGREKLKSYFRKESVIELIEFLETIAEKVEINPAHFICRDPKGNFPPRLIDFSGADYLVTGDEDLLEHNPFKTAVILAPAGFEKVLVDR